MGRPLLPGERLIYFANPHQARAWLAGAASRGEIARVSPLEQRGEIKGRVRDPSCYVVVHVMKEARKLQPRLIAMVTAVLATLISAALVIYLYRWWILAAIGVLMAYGLARRARRTASITVTQTVKIRR